MKLVFRFFLSVMILVASTEATAVNDPSEILRLLNRVKIFLCDRGNCPQKIPTIYFEEKDGYHGYHSNTRISVSPRLDSIDTQFTLAHELVHAYRAEFNPDEETWLNEGLAKFIEYQYSTIWPISYVERLKRNPSINLELLVQDGYAKNYGPGGDGYPASFFLTLYLYNRFGQEKLLQKLISSKKSGWDNILSGIHELAQDHSIDIAPHLISKENILRHFAVSLWMNDIYLAKYALFQLDPKYEPLAKLNITEFPPVSEPEKGAVKIQFHSKFQNSNAQNVYSILSYEPFVIKSAEPQDKALVFIYLFY